jgi:hypothetical protein
MLLEFLGDAREIEAGLVAKIETGGFDAGAVELREAAARRRDECQARSSGYRSDRSTFVLDPDPRHPKKAPPCWRGFLRSQTRGPTLPRLGDQLVGDQLCPALQSFGVRYKRYTKQVGILVLPHVSHFMQVPFRTRAWNSCNRCTSRFRSSSPRRAGFGPSYASRFSVGENRC